MSHVPVFNKTRIAPTPSGYLHLGNLLSFTITAGLARKHKASILLRIDDLDQERVRKEYVEDIFDTLEFMGIPWDEGPRNYDEYIRAWSQAHRIHLYEKTLEYLRCTQHVFACNCSRSSNYTGACLDKDLSLESSAINWRVKTDQTLPPSMQNFVVRKKDGSAAYQLSSLIDDSYFGVDLVVRGEDLQDSTLAQIYLGSLLPGNSFPQSTFYHHSLLTGSDGQKLSKSTGASSIRHLRSQGMTSAGIYTQLGNLLGCDGQPSTWEEFFSLLQSVTITAH
jgi:glutamyl-tRNA synthetase